MVLGYSLADLGALLSIRICKWSFAVISGRGDRLLRRFFRPGQRRARMEANMPVVVSMMVTACSILPCPSGYLVHRSDI